MQIPSHVSIFVRMRKPESTMKIKLIMIGKTDTGWIRTGLGVYADRLARYINFSMTELPDIKNAASLSREQLKTKEGELLLRNFSPADHVVLLDEKGKEYSSMEWSARLEDRMAHLSGDIVFVIGGAYGFSDAVYARCNEKVSLSRMTFSHQMVRVIFAEQLYRAFTIMKGEPYHHE